MGGQDPPPSYLRGSELSSCQDVSGRGESWMKKEQTQ